VNHSPIPARARRPVATLLVLLGLLPGAAQAALGANEAELLEYAEAHHPALAAAHLEREASVARRDAAGKLEDPMLELELRDIPRDSPTLSPARAGSTRYQFSQRLPSWGKRGLQKQIAGSDVNRADAEAADARLELRQQVRTAYAARWAAARSLQALDELDRTLVALEQLARGRYASGLAPQQDAIRAAVERTELARRRLALEAAAAEAASNLNAALARDIDAPLDAPVDAPAPIPVPALADLRARQDAANPALAAASAEIEKARASEQLTRRNRYPDLVLGVAPIQMGNALEAWDLMLSVSLPLQWGRRHAEEREAQLMSNAATLRRAALGSELAGEVGGEWTQWRNASRQAQVIEGTLLPQTEANYRSALGSYKLGEVDFGTLLEALRQWTTSRLELIDLQLDTQMRATRIARLTGEAP
jgi:outer membrane protein, heavy metal efflux system